ncbi:Fcf2 pre-rRNA processing-domain-containing protein [Rhodofomes roseus]|uniref:Fcf2 pre-rRNA processing-domain-containing protein n=1 Tax=Rhodofomes roseus TaxID=34475 RepID=A0ABQ8KSQ0_9APHY|nr:Fcf2 pre-rRNA processing-domain-containing protein [Rhodofomes roseus]KAH9841851.1 Fcf2 pre-rRNA processing-domain-containing protein [Rhodofomes roseus]
MTAVTAPLSPKSKGKSVQRGVANVAESQSQTGSTSDLSSDSHSESSASSSDTSDSDSDSEEEVGQEFLDSLLEKARRNAALKAQDRERGSQSAVADEEEIRLDTGDEDTQKPLPPLDPGKLPKPYFDLADSKQAGPSRVRDLDIEQAEQASSSRVVPASPPYLPEPTKSGRPLTKKETKALKNKTAGPDWFDLPAPAEADLPRLYREYEALRLRNQLDPKRFYKKDEGEGKGIKGLPKHFAMGTIVASPSPFGGPNAENLSRAERKRTLVDELVDDAEAKSYAKKKFKELQSVRSAKGRGTLAKKKALRKPKW